MRSKKRLPAPIYGIGKSLRTMRKDPETIAWEGYFIPGTTTMRNNLGTPQGHYGITDARELTRQEEKLSMIRALELRAHPVAGSFNYDHMKETHQRLFQDVYPWAGQERTVGMVKNGHQYAPVNEISDIWARQTKAMAESHQLKDFTNQNEFVDNLAQHWGMINYAHAFREGNTRSQTAFFSQLSAEAGWDLDASRLDPSNPHSLREEFVAARFHYQDYRAFDHKPLAQVLSQIITPSPQRQLQIPTPALNTALPTPIRPTRPMRPVQPATALKVIAKPGIFSEPDSESDNFDFY